MEAAAQPRARAPARPMARPRARATAGPTPRDVAGGARRGGAPPSLGWGLKAQAAAGDAPGRRRRPGAA
eukprot:5329773-Lingulodinium_polyedra.AAC.1